MNSKITRTPYNSIYESVTKNGSGGGGEVLCCLHGGQCLMAKREKTLEAAKLDENNQYVNLAPLSKEEKMATQLATKLSKLAADESSTSTSNGNLASLQTILGSESSGGGRRPKQESASESDQKYYPIGKRDASPQTNRTTSGAVTESSFSQVEGKDSSTAQDENHDDRNKMVMSNDSKSIMANVFKSPSTSIYLGVCSKNDAEYQVARRTDFALYHQIISHRSLDTLIDALPLMIVYRSARNGFRHFVIRCSTSLGGDPHFFVDYGRPCVRKHHTLNHLVKYYQNHASLDSDENMEIDLFSSWNDR